MTDPRKPLYDALRALNGGTIPTALFNDMQALLDRHNVPRETPAGGRKASPAGIALIHEFESLRLSTYRDPGPTGLPITGGWGSTTDENGRPFQLGRTEPKAYWDRLFERDLTRFTAAVNALVGTATQNQFDALVSFAYNVGEGNLKSSTLLRKHKAGDYAGAALEFARWNKAKGVVLAGLTRRRAAEAAMYRGQR